MLFDPILDGIKVILEADANTKDVIKLYRKYDRVEQGIYNVPFCMLGADLDVSIEAVGLSNLHIYEGPITILLLGRSYDTPEQHQTMIDVLDLLQSNVYKALNAKENRKLNNTVIGSLVSRIRYVRISEEYFGFEFTVTVKTKID